MFGREEASGMIHAHRMLEDGVRFKHWHGNEYVPHQHPQLVPGSMGQKQDSRDDTTMSWTEAEMEPGTKRDDSFLWKEEPQIRTMTVGEYAEEIAKGTVTMDITIRITIEMPEHYDTKKQDVLVEVANVFREESIVKLGMVRSIEVEVA